MPRFSITQLLMGTALVALLVVLWQSEPIGNRSSMIESLSFSKDGSQIAVAKLMARDASTPGKRVRSDISRTISLIDVSSGVSSKRIGQDFHKGPAGFGSKLWYRGRQSVLINPGNGKIVTTSFDQGNRVILDIEKPKTGNVTLDYPPNYVTASTSGRLVACSGLGCLTVCNTETGKPLLNVTTDSMPFLSGAIAVFTEDESTVIVVADESIDLFDVATGKRTRFYSENGMRIPDLLLNVVALGPENTIVVCDSSWVRQYDLDGRLIASLQEGGGCSLCATTTGGEQLATIGNHVLKTYEMEPEPKLIQEFEVPGSTSVAISPDGSTVAVGDSNGNVTLYDFQIGNPLWEASPPGRSVIVWPWPAAFLFAWLVLALLLHFRARSSPSS